MRAILITIVTSALFGCGTSPVAPTTASIPGVISKDFLFGLNHVEHAYGDIDHDGTPECFLGSTASCGNAGMTYLVLKRDGENWRPMGEIFLHPGAFRILPLATDGSIRLLGYHHMSCSEGIVNTFTYRGGAFVTIHSETIHSDASGTDEGSRRYAELFSENSPGQPLQCDKDEKGILRSPAGISQITVTRNEHRTVRGVTITLHDGEFKYTIRPDQIVITEDKHHSDLRELMAWTVIPDGHRLRITFKDGLGDFGSGNAVRITINRSALAGYTGTDDRIEWRISTDPM